MNVATSKIQVLINEVRLQVQQADTTLENAFQEREDIIATPIPRQEVKDNFAQAVDVSAERFKETLKSQKN